MLLELIKIVRDVGPCAETFAHNLQEYERRAMLRYVESLPCVCARGIVLSEVLSFAALECQFAVRVLRG